MILVALGTQDKPFIRLLEAVQTCINNGTIKEEVIVQAGHTKFESNDMKIFDLIPMDEMQKLITDCNILITHGGVATIIEGLKNNKKVIAAARLKQYGEHKNDHQLQIIKHLKFDGYLKALNNFDDLSKIIKGINKFKPKKYVSNTKNMIKIVSKFIENN